MDAETWEDEFYNELEEREVPGDWELYEDEDLDLQGRGARYTQRTFGRFQCSACKRWWNSAEVHVLFFMTLNKAQQLGTVNMRIFRQECRKCSFPKLEKPDISHENIMRMIKNLVTRILQVFYGEQKPKQDWKPEVYSNDIDGPHDKEHCEACKLMICKWQIVSTKQQSTARASSAQNKPAHKPSIHSKGVQIWSDGITSSYVSQSTTTYQGTTLNVQSTTTYQGTTSNVQSTTTYPGTTSNIRSTTTYPGTTSNVKCSTTYPGTTSNVRSTTIYPGTTSNVRSTTTYPGTTSNVQSPKTYTNYDSDFRSTSVCPKYTTEIYAADPPPCEKESSPYSMVFPLIAGIGALALLYFKR